MKRFFDIAFSLTGLILLSPLFIIISIIIYFDSGYPIFYKAIRVGLNKGEFKFIKFRTMIPNSDKSYITIGDNDPRITRTGSYLRKFKLDELPQLFNVLKGDMSFVGPRPDIAKYSPYYEKGYKDYYKIKPGITSYSSIYFSNEAELYKNIDDPELLYINQTIPRKIELDKKYFDNISVVHDFKIILVTVWKLIKCNEE